MGFWDDLTGNSAADASNTAAADTYAKQIAAANATRAAGAASGQRYATDVSGLASNYDPYVGAGRSALTQLLGGLGLGGPGGSAAFTQAYRSLPGYQSGLDTGTNAAIKAAAAGGRLNSGGTLKALQRYGSDYEDQRVGDYLTRLTGLQGQGLQATGAQTGVLQNAYQGRLGAEIGANNAAGAMDFNAAGTIGEGMVAGEQAKQGALQNLLGTGAFLGGSYLGGNKSGGGSKGPSGFSLPIPKLGFFGL